MCFKVCIKVQVDDVMCSEGMHLGYYAASISWYLGTSIYVCVCVCVWLFPASKNACSCYISIKSITC